MAFTPDDVKRLAALARLELSAGEIDAFARQLGDILAFAEQVQSIESAAGDATVLPPAPAVRDDVVLPSLPLDTVLAAAPDADRGAGLFKVPRVLQG